MRKLLITFFLAAVVSVPACVTDSSRAPADDDDGGSTPSETTSLTPEEGGTLSDGEGIVTLTVPPGAVDEATIVTLDVRQPEAGTLGPVYRFTPAELSFGVAATITIGLAGVSPPEGKTMAVASHTDGAWVALGDLTPSAGGVSAPIMGLGDFALIAIDAVDEGPCAASCMDQPGAACCTSCGCEAEVSCSPVCGAGKAWDCELGCCYDATGHACVE